MATETRGVNALEGPELGALMAQAMQQRVRNKTTTSQRARLLRDLSRGGRGNIVEAPGARLAAGEEAIADIETWEAKLKDLHSMRLREDNDIALAQREASMANALGRGLQGDPNDPMNLQGGDQMWTDAPSLASQVPAAPSFQGELGGTTAEEEALLAQMQADMVNQPGDQGFTAEGYIPGGAGALPGAATPQTNWDFPDLGQQGQSGASQAGPQGFTSEGYVPGGPGALPQATPSPQTPQVAGTATTALVTSQAQQPSDQGFTSTDYVEGQQAEAGPLDTAGSAALQWLNELFKGDKAQGGQGSPQFGGTELGMVPEGRRTEQGFSAKDYVTGGQQALVGAQQGGMTPEEQQKLQQITQGLKSSRPDQNADATVSWPTIADQGAQTPGGFQQGTYNPDMAMKQRDESGRLQEESFMDYTKRMHQMRSSGQQTQASSGANADEIIGSLLERYGSQLKMAGYGEQVEKFSSGNYTKADVDGLIGQFGGMLPKNILAQLQQVSESMAAEEGAVAGTEAANVVTEDLPGLDPNYAGQQGTTSSGSSQFTTQHGFGAKDYNPAVAIRQGETFMEYTQRMHRERQERNWVDPDKSRLKATGLDSYR